MAQVQELYGVERVSSQRLAYGDEGLLGGDVGEGNTSQGAIRRQDSPHGCQHVRMAHAMYSYAPEVCVVPEGRYAREEVEPQLRQRVDAGTLAEVKVDRPNSAQALYVAHKVQCWLGVVVVAQGYVLVDEAVGAEGVQGEGGVEAVHTLRGQVDLDLGVLWEPHGDAPVCCAYLLDDGGGNRRGGALHHYAHVLLLVVLSHHLVQHLELFCDALLALHRLDLEDIIVVDGPIKRSFPECALLDQYDLVLGHDQDPLIEGLGLQGWGTLDPGAIPHLIGEPIRELAAKRDKLLTYELIIGLLYIGRHIRTWKIFFVPEPKSTFAHAITGSRDEEYLPRANMSADIQEADDQFISEQLIPLGGQFTYGFTDEVWYRTWVERTPTLKAKSFDKRILVVTKYKVILVKKSAFGKRSLDRAIHYYDILEIKPVEGEERIAEQFEMLYQVVGKNDKKENMGIVVKCPSASVASTIVKQIRTAYRRITVGFPEDAQIKINLPPERVDRLDPTFTLHPLSANGLIDQYIALSYYYNTKPTLDFVRHIEGLCAVGSVDLDLSECPGIDPLSELGFNLFTGISSLRHNTYFRSVRVHRVSHPNVLAAVGTVLATNRTLTRVALTDITTEQSFIPIGKSLAGNPFNAIQFLDLSHNNLNFQALASLCDAISKFPHGLLRLELESCNIPPKGVEMVFNALERNFGSSLQLQHLNLSHNRFQETGSGALASWLAKVKGCHSLQTLLFESCQLHLSVMGPPLRVANVQTLNLAGNRVGDRTQARYLGDVMECYTQMKEVNFSNMRIGPEAAEELATMMSRNKSLAPGTVNLILANNELGQKGAIQLARFLPQSQFIRSLDLSNNKIPAKALTEVLMSLGTSKSIESLNLSRNIPNTNDLDAFITNLCEYVVQHPTLKSLSIRGAKPGLGAALYPLLMLIARNQTLTHLDVSDNNLKDLGASIAGEALRTNNTLTSLDIDRNGFTMSGWMAITSPVLYRTNRTLQHLSIPLKAMLRVSTASAPAPDYNLTKDKDHEPEVISLNKPSYDQLLDLLSRVDQRLKMNRPSMPPILNSPSVPTPTTVVPLVEIPEHLSLMAPPPIARRRPTASPSSLPPSVGAVASPSALSPSASVAGGATESVMSEVEFSPPTSGFSPIPASQDWAEEDSWSGSTDDYLDDESTDDEQTDDSTPKSRSGSLTHSAARDNTPNGSPRVSRKASAAPPVSTPSVSSPLAAHASPSVASPAMAAPVVSSPAAPSPSVASPVVPSPSVASPAVFSPSPLSASSSLPLRSSGSIPAPTSSPSPLGSSGSFPAYSSSPAPESNAFPSSFFNPSPASTPPTTPAAVPRATVVSTGPVVPPPETVPDEDDLL
eukprot:TRINITY_DN8493_c0_g1_i6.p1 TRINITY_DN8493_c0_g1~~TRINITY_DN8493_c0_g1_i6.p1  ORF type:complete len:1356 (-),score=351.93 TRINITY_DN8493_c0_g1_i6:60-4127(-)